MDYPLKILRKALANEKLWLACVAHDARSTAGKKMAQIRVPQLEKAIARLKDDEPIPDKPKPPPRKKFKNQLSLWQLLNPNQ